MLTVILGKTCSGKSTIVRKLCEKYNYNKILTYTTRPKREHEKDGIDYHFIDDETFYHFRDLGKFSEYKSYHVAGGHTWWYGSMLGDLDDDKDYLIILTPQGLRDVQDELDSFASIYIYTNRDTMKKRLIKRGDDVNEASRRMMRDNEDFNGVENEVNRIVYNNADNDIYDVVDRVHHVIQSLKKNPERLKNKRYLQ